MALQFTDLEEDGDEAVELSHVGILFSEPDGTWHAYRPGSKFAKSDTGTPQKLERGLWVSDMSYDEANAIAKTLPGVTLRSDGWFKMTIPQMKAALGLTALPAPVALRFIAAVCDRVFRLTQQAIVENIEDLGYASLADLITKIERSPSLATAISKVNLKPMSRSASSDSRVKSHLDASYQAGMMIPKRKEKEEGSVLLSFHFPRISYAKRLTADPVPSGGMWQKADRDSKTSIPEFMSSLAKTQRPLIYRAVCQPGEAAPPEYIRFFANTFASGGMETYRSRLTSDEVSVLDPYFDLQIEGVIAGSGWEASATGALILGLEKAAGGELLAASSWSVGLVAENILNSAFRFTPPGKGDLKAGKEEGSKPAESIWLAARDRKLMLPAIRALYDVGAILASASCGNIVVKCPEDPEILNMVVNTAWESGLVLPLEEVEHLQSIGVYAPVETSHFGGNAVDYLMSTLVHSGRRNALLKLDTIMDHPVHERDRMLRALMRGSEKG